MPVSKKRKKDGKSVKQGTLTVDPEKESNISLQDLINVVAYREYIKDGRFVPPAVEIKFDDPVPVTIEDENGEKRQIGTASPIPGDPEHASIYITDEKILRRVQGPAGNYSIDKENDNGQH